MEARPALDAQHAIPQETLFVISGQRAKTEAVALIDFFPVDPIARSLCGLIFQSEQKGKA